MHQILLIDDEPYVVDDLSISLPWTEMGFEQVHKAYSGYEALELLQRYPIDIVVTDINMPEISGIELIASIRSRWKHIRVVMLTGYAEFEYARKAIEEQASAYLLKPIANDQLVAVIGRLQEELRGEWETWSSYQRTMQTFREHLPLLRDRLLGEPAGAEDVQAAAARAALPIRSAVLHQPAGMPCNRQTGGVLPASGHGQHAAVRIRHY